MIEEACLLASCDRRKRHRQETGTSPVSASLPVLPGRRTSLMLARAPLLAVVASLAFAAPSGAASAPRVSSFSLSPSSFAPAAPGKRATVLRFRLSRAATVRITIARALHGRYVRRGTLTRQFRAGKLTLGFSGNLAGRRLKPGSYRATLVATARGRR